MNTCLTRRDLLGSVAGLSVLACANPLNAKTPEIYGNCRDMAKAAVASGAVMSIAIAVLRNGRIEWEEAFGWADRERRIPATARTSYSLASISKPFTATALMTLVSSGKIDLDRTINDYLDAGKVRMRIGDEREATVRRVASHTSGLPFHAQFFYADTPYRRPPESETIAKWAQVISRPGERYFYSNLGFGLLGDVVAHGSGESFGRYLETSVLAPLGLSDSALGTPSLPSVQAAARYTTAGARLPDYVTDHAGASEVYSSAHDLVRFAAFHLKAHLPGQQAILSPAEIDSMHVNISRPGSPRGYGIGFSRGLRHGYDTVSHSGAMPGVATEMILVPSEGVAFVVLSNTWDSATVSKLTDAVAAAILPKWKSEQPGKPTDSPKGEPPAALAGLWTGHVARPEGDLPVTLTIGRDGGIAARFGDKPEVAVEDPELLESRLTGHIKTPLDAEDTRRYPNTIRLDLKAEGDRLYGGAVALDNMKSQTFIAGLTFWTDLRWAGTGSDSARS